MPNQIPTSWWKKTDPATGVLSLPVTPQCRSLLATIDDTTIDLEARTVEVSISSEFPVERDFGFEILDHSPDSVIFTRMHEAPLLKDHDRGKQIGKVERAWVTEHRTMRAVVRYARDPESDVVWQQVVDRIRTNYSLTYLLREGYLEREINGVPYYRITKWEPYEVSSVSVPADPTVGYGRSATESTNTLIIRGPSMSANAAEAAEPSVENNLPGQDGSQSRSLPADPAKAERVRVQDLIALGDTHNQRDLANKAISEGWSVQKLQTVMLRGMAPAPVETGGEGQRDLPNFMQPGQNMRELGVKDEEIQRYSLMRAINAMATGNWKEAGFERSISIAIADASKKEARGLFVPHEVVFQRQLEKKTPGKGGVLVETDLRVDQFVDELRNKAMIGRLGARVLSGLQGDLAIPRKTSGTNFYWLDEDDEPELSDFDFSTIALTPKTIAGALCVTRRLRKQSSLSVENLMRQDMIAGIAVAIDLAQLTGTGQNNQPLGLLNQPGLPGGVYDGSVAWGDLVDMETEIALANADESGMAYLTSPFQRGVAKKTQVFANTGERLWDKDNTVNGYKSYATNQMPRDAWLFGDWSQIITALWGVMDINVDTSAKAGSDGLVLRVFQDVDTQARRLDSFYALRKKLATGG